MRPERTNAAAFVPEQPTLPKLQQAVGRCRGCDLYRFATQAVFGEGPVHASIVFVGEQPGNDEDKKGHPFVGPAGRLLDRALADAGIERADVYVTNAVKHFKFEERGKRRLHKKPRASEIEACHPWLEAELEVIKPEIVVCLGATAAQSMLGPTLPADERARKFLSAPQRTPRHCDRSPVGNPARARLRTAPGPISGFVSDLKRIRDELRVHPRMQAIQPASPPRLKPAASIRKISDSGSRSGLPRRPARPRRTPRSSSG